MASIRSTLFKLALMLLTCSALCRPVPYDYGFDVGRHVERQLAEPFVVRGETNGDIQVRQEIRQLEQDADQWTLYILGLSLLQFTDESSPTSWYSLTGLLSPCAMSGMELAEVADRVVGRDTRYTSLDLGRRRTDTGKRGHRILHPFLGALSDVASTLSRPL